MDHTILWFWYPEVQYTRNINNELIYSILEDTIDYIGEKIEAYILGNQKFEVDSWKDFSISLIKLLNDYDSIKMRKIIQSRATYNKVLASHLTFREQDLRHPIEVISGSGIFLEGHTNTRTIVQVLKLLIELMEYQEEIFIVLKVEKNDNAKS